MPFLPSAIGPPRQAPALQAGEFGTLHGTGRKKEADRQEEGTSPALGILQPAGCVTPGWFAAYSGPQFPSHNMKQVDQAMRTDLVHGCSFPGPSEPLNPQLQLRERADGGEGLLSQGHLLFCQSSTCWWHGDPPPNQFLPMRGGTEQSGLRLLTASAQQESRRLRPAVFPPPQVVGSLNYA